MNDLIFKNVSLRGIYGRRIFDSWDKASAMLESGLDFGDLITHRFVAEDFKNAFELVASANCGKVLLDWRQSVE